MDIGFGIRYPHRVCGSFPSVVGEMNELWLYSTLIVLGLSVIFIKAWIKALSKWWKPPNRAKAMRKWSMSTVLDWWRGCSKRSGYSG